MVRICSGAAQRPVIEDPTPHAKYPYIQAPDDPYCGWCQLPLHRAIYLVAWHTLRLPDNEFARLYTRLAPRKCVYDERMQEYRGKGKVIGRVAGQLITVMFTLLKRDQDLLAQGGSVPDPELYDPEVHRRHRAGQYPPPARIKLGNVVQLPSQ